MQNKSNLSPTMQKALDWLNANPNATHMQQLRAMPSRTINALLDRHKIVYIAKDKFYTQEQLQKIGVAITSHK